MPERQPKRGRLWLNDGSCIRLRPLYRGHVWSYDFVASRTHDGRALKLLTQCWTSTRGSAGRAAQAAPVLLERLASTSLVDRCLGLQPTMSL